jgi:uncharacterized protein
MIRPAREPDFDRILVLNKRFEHFLSPMDRARLERMHPEAAYLRVVEVGGEVAAFLLGFREGAGYDSVNYRWFDERFDRFLYVDRVVVAETHQAAGLGSLLYTDFFAFAREHGVPIVTCEYDVEPPNEVSRKFHARFGFEEIGTQWYDGKCVSLQKAPA